MGCLAPLLRLPKAAVAARLHPGASRLAAVGAPWTPDGGRRGTVVTDRRVPPLPYTFELAGNVATLLAARWLELSEGFLMMAHPLEGFGACSVSSSVALCVQGDGVRACTGTRKRERVGGRTAATGQRVKCR